MSLDRPEEAPPRKNVHRQALGRKGVYVIETPHGVTPPFTPTKTRQNVKMLVAMQALLKAIPRTRTQ